MIQRNLADDLIFFQKSVFHVKSDKYCIYTRRTVPSCHLLAILHRECDCVSNADRTTGPWGAASQQACDILEIVYLSQ